MMKIRNKLTGENYNSNMKKRRLPLSAYLTYLLLASVLFTGVTFSGYVSTTMGNTQGRVAKFEIKEEGVYEKMIAVDIVPGEVKTHELSIQNKSEVAVEYTITIRNNTKNLPIEFEVVDMGQIAGEDFIYSETLRPNSVKKVFPLRISWPEDSYSAYYAGMVDTIIVSVSAVQKD